MEKLIFYPLLIAVIFGAGFVAGSKYSERSSRVSSYLRRMRSPGDYGDN